MNYSKYIIIYFILLCFLLNYNFYIKYGGSKYYVYNDSLWIYNNFYSDNDFKKIQKYCSILKLKNDKRNNNRLTLCLNQNKHKKLYNLIYNKKFISFINSIKESNLNLKSIPTYPIEYRKYFNGSKGMDWHQDTSLFYPDAFEVVLTLNNNSDSKFSWQTNNKIQSINPKSNTLVIVKPMTILHNVSPINVGERTILKFIAEFNHKDKKNNIKKSTFTDEIQKCQFD